MSKSQRGEMQRPIKELKLGRIRAAIWLNESKNGAMYNTTFSRIYRDDDGQWHDSTSFGRDDLPLLHKLADRVHSWIFEQAQSNAPSDTMEGDSRS